MLFLRGARYFATRVNPVTLANKGKTLIWSKGYTLTPSKGDFSMNDLADVLNNKLKRTKRDKNEVYDQLYEMVISVGKAEDITVYAAATVLCYGSRFKELPIDVMQNLLIPCIDQKLEYMDSESIGEVLNSCTINEELRKNPIVDKLKKFHEKQEIIELSNKFAGKNTYFLVGQKWALSNAKGRIKLLNEAKGKLMKLFMNVKGRFKKKEPN